MNKLSDRVISEELERYRVVATTEISSAIRSYIPLMLHWNKKISLTTVTDPIEIVRFHFGESMFAAPFLSHKNGRLADVGSGAGFPGIPLKLAVPTLELVLIESNARKASFLAEVIRELKLEAVRVHRGRFEDVGQRELGFDYIAARALGMHKKLMSWSRTAIKVGGGLILWLGEDDAAGVSAQSSWEWRGPLPIPGSHRRTVLIGTPTF
jgi:16S rRNA (guanine527-N7)-methyltransferase